MGMMLPNELIWIMDKLGFEWPDLDEDEIRKAAVLLRQYGEDLDATIAWADQRINADVVGTTKGNAGLAYADGWNQARSQHLQQLVDFIDPAATGVDVFADAVLALKVKVIAEVTITAAQVVAALASAAFTFGAGAAVAAGLIIARKKALDALTDMAVEEVMAQVLPMIIEPFTQQIPAVVDAVLNAPVVTGAVGEVGEYQMDLAALEQASADLETNAQDQESITEQFLADIAALNITGG
ncbi:hypothetical protein ACJ5H2_16955 [Nocardioides sp. R1-1]|uniref:WXG100-like domain-containing protein n=1 Tax=Nocardioides sp. R1-1 TaxID=3383502 RepID=UPI0038D12605